jgi:pyrimidine operon attenuation protein/uracil phosphoribosyltransferase
MSDIKLPDAEQLVATLAGQMRGRVSVETGLVGIVTGGAWLAERLHRELKLEVPFGTLDISFYRDDFQAKGLKRRVKRSEIPFEVEGRDLILVDDVLYTGRTIRAAMNELFDYGRPASIALAALIDRGGRELPIAAQYVGAAVSVPAQMTVELERAADGRLKLALTPANGRDRAH